MISSLAASAESPRTVLAAVTLGWGTQATCKLGWGHPSYTTHEESSLAASAESTRTVLTAATLGRGHPSYITHEESSLAALGRVILRPRPSHLRPRPPRLSRYRLPQAMSAHRKNGQSLGSIPYVYGHYLEPEPCRKRHVTGLESTCRLNWRL